MFIWHIWPYKWFMKNVKKIQFWHVLKFNPFGRSDHLIKSALKQKMEQTEKKGNFFQVFANIWCTLLLEQPFRSDLHFSVDSVAATPRAMELIKMCIRWFLPIYISEICWDIWDIFVQHLFEIWNCSLPSAPLHWILKEESDLHIF